MAKNANRGRPEVLVEPQANDAPEHPEMEIKHPLEVMQMAAAKASHVESKDTEGKLAVTPTELWEILEMAGDNGLTSPWDPSITS